jgi:hypothetical protein
MSMRHHRLGLTGLLLLAGCGGSPTLPPEPTVAAPPAAPAAPADAVAPPAPAGPVAEAPQAPAAPPTEPTTAPPLAFAPPAVDTPAPPPVASSGGGGGGGGGGGSARPATAPPRLSFSAITVDSQMAAAPKEGLADQNADTRWASRSRTGAWAQVTLKEPQRLMAVSLSMPPGLRYHLFTSIDGKAWTQKGWGLVNQSWSLESKRLQAQARYVRVAQAGPTTADRPFAILELRVHADEGAEVAALPPPPPWQRPVTAFTEANIREAKLGYLADGHADTELHIHAYLTVWYNGKKVIIPANLGIASGRMAYLHTHDTTGTVHMEGPLGLKFTLGQVFTLWGVPLTGAKVYVEGARVATPAALRLRDKLSVDVVFGKPPVGVAGVPLE